MKKNKLFIIIIAIIIVVGVIVYLTKGFNKELMYADRQEITISQSKEFDIAKVKEIVKEVLVNKKVEIQQVERFGNAVEIISTEISEEEKENLINKINEEYSSDISKDDIDIITISNTRVKDILKPYILPGIITFAAILLYFVIIYHKIGLKDVLLKGIFTPIAVELTYFAIVLITRIPYGRITNGVATGLYVFSIACLAVCFQKEKQKFIDEKENDE